MNNDVYTDYENQDSSVITEPDVQPQASLYGFVFHYNYFTNNWCAIPRDKYTQYWSNVQTEGVLCSKQIQTLVDIIQRTNGDPILIQKLISE